MGERRMNLTAPRRHAVTGKIVWDRAEMDVAFWLEIEATRMLMHGEEVLNKMSTWSVIDAGLQYSEGRAYRSKYPVGSAVSMEVLATATLCVGFRDPKEDMGDRLAVLVPRDCYIDESDNLARIEAYWKHMNDPLSDPTLQDFDPSSVRLRERKVLERVVWSTNWTEAECSAARVNFMADALGAARALSGVDDAQEAAS